MSDERPKLPGWVMPIMSVGLGLIAAGVVHGILMYGRVGVLEKQIAAFESERMKSYETRLNDMVMHDGPRMTELEVVQREHERRLSELERSR